MVIGQREAEKRNWPYVCVHQGGKEQQQCDYQAIIRGN